MEGQEIYIKKKTNDKLYFASCIDQNTIHKSLDLVTWSANNSNVKSRIAY